MGYTTNFKGELKFTKELKASELAKLSSMLGEDCREHPEWDYEGPLYYIDLLVCCLYHLFHIHFHPDPLFLQLYFVYN